MKFFIWPVFDRWQHLTCELIVFPIWHEVVMTVYKLNYFCFAGLFIFHSTNSCLSADCCQMRRVCGSDATECPLPGGSEYITWMYMDIDCQRRELLFLKLHRVPGTTDCCLWYLCTQIFKGKKSFDFFTKAKVFWFLLWCNLSFLRKPIPAVPLAKVTYMLSRETYHAVQCLCFIHQTGVLITG